MKKPLFLIIPLLLTFTFLTCEEPPPPPVLTLDERLMGDRWYFVEDLVGYNGDNVTITVTPRTSEGYYEFTSDSILEFSEETKLMNCVTIGEIRQTDQAVYSKDGIIYWKHNNEKVMQYEFPDIYPNKSPYPEYLHRYMLNYLAHNGDLILYRLFNSVNYYEDQNGNSHWYLVRCKEEGSTYHYDYYY